MTIYFFKNLQKGKTENSMMGIRCILPVFDDVDLFLSDALTSASMSFLVLHISGSSRPTDSSNELPFLTFLRLLRFNRRT